MLKTGNKPTRPFMFFILNLIVSSFYSLKHSPSKFYIFLFHIGRLKGLSPRFKKLGKIRIWSKLSWGLIYGLSFQIQSSSQFPQNLVQKTGLIFNLADFHDRNWRIPGFCENKTQHWALLRGARKTKRKFSVGSPIVSLFPSLLVSKASPANLLIFWSK